MVTFLRSATTAVCIAAAIQCFTVGYLAPRIPLQVCRPYVEQAEQFSFAPTPEVRIDNNDGAVRVAVHEEDQILLTATIKAYAQDSETEAIAQEYVKSLLKVERSAGALKVLTEPDSRPDNLELEVDYQLTVPPGTDITIRGSNGNVWVGEACGDITVESNNADVEVLSPGGNVSAKVANGRIVIHQAKNNTVLETVNGSIYADMLGGSLQASTANGNISAEMLAQDANAANLTAMNGGITLLLPEEYSASIHATTGSGEVKSDIPLTELKGFRKRREFHGAIGSEGANLTMNSLNGNILITRSTS
jgi:hypothetical protein